MLPGSFGTPGVAPCTAGFGIEPGYQAHDDRDEPEEHTNIINTPTCSSIRMTISNWPVIKLTFVSADMQGMVNMLRDSPFPDTAV